jgi:hypothetical protein
MGWVALESGMEMTTMLAWIILDGRVEFITKYFASGADFPVA